MTRRLGRTGVAVLLVAVATGAFGGERIEPGRVQAPPGEPPPARTAQAERGGQRAVFRHLLELSGEIRAVG